MYTLFFHNNAIHDLHVIRAKDMQIAARILTLLQEIQQDQYLLDSLTIHNFGSTKEEQFHISKWFELWNRGYDLWRLKIWDLDATGIRYRVIYAYLRGRKNYYVLGIVPRDFDYDIHHPTTKRIIAAYQDLQ